MTTAHVFIATSLDGQIARADGEIDWLAAVDTAGEDHGYAAFIADMDVIVMGRGTYEKVLSFGQWPYALPTLVLSRQLAGSAVPAALLGKVQFSAATPAEAMAQLAAQGYQRAYVDGGQVVQSFLRAGLIDDMVLTTIPVLIGRGRPLFGDLPQDVRWRLRDSRHFASGLVQSQYQREA